MDLAGGEFAVACAVILAGALVRGFTGFGASLIWVSGLTFLMEPREAVPVIFCLEVVVSAQLLPACRRDVDWDTLRFLLGGVAVGLPLGAAVLLALDPEPMRVLVAVVVLGSVVLLASGRRPPVGSGRAGCVTTGVASGLLNGAAASGGPPVIVYFLGTTGGMAIGRASLIAFFGVTDLLGIGVVAATGLLDATALWRAVALVPAMVVGAAVGARGFGLLPEQTVRRAALVTLAMLALVMILTNL